MRISCVPLLLSAACLSAQVNAPAPAFDGARAFDHLRAVVAIGPRPAGSSGAQRTRAYVREQLAALGITAEEQPFEADTPIGPITMANVRAVIPGPGTGRIVIAGHYDTKRFSEFEFVGANDGGSSTAFLLEFARVLKARANGTTYELLFLDGEEAVRRDWVDPDNTYGSRHYVRAAREAGTLKDIRALVLVDMVADRDLRLLREENSTPWLTDIIWSTARNLKRPEFVSASTPIEDDHLRFLEAGVPAVDIIDLEYPAWHTPEDTLDKCSPASMEAVGTVLLAALPEIERRADAIGKEK